MFTDNMSISKQPNVGDSRIAKYGFNTAVKNLSVHKHY